MRVYDQKIKFTVDFKQRLIIKLIKQIYKKITKNVYLRLVFNFGGGGAAVGFKALPCLIESNSCSLGVGCLFRGFNLRSDALK